MTTTIATPEPPRRAVLIALPRELVVTNRQMLKAEILDALDAGAQHLDLDCSATRFTDASGLGVLVSVRKACESRGVDLTLTRVNPELRALLVEYRLDTLFCLEPSAARAAAPTGGE